jgi:exopolysaccharide biosynthesis protein
MEELLTKYTLTEIILFIFALATALKGFFTLWDFFYDRIKKHFVKETTKEQEKTDLTQQLADISTQIKGIRDGHKEDKAEILEQVKNINIQHTLDRQELIKKIDETKTTISVLLASDKDDIKSWITEKHHYFCYEKKVIDDYSLDCIEKRYQHYLDEGGNSYVATLMNEIRALPKVSMLREIEKENKKR